MPLDTVLEACCISTASRTGRCRVVKCCRPNWCANWGNGDGIDVAVRSMAAHIVDWHHFNFATIAAAIISYCRSKRIPLPYSA